MCDSMLVSKNKLLFLQCQVGDNATFILLATKIDSRENKFKSLKRRTSEYKKQNKALSEKENK